MASSAAPLDTDTAPSVALSYGSIAFNVGRGRLSSNPEHTHQWTVFLRGAFNQDITYAVSKVVFTLHPSFADPIRGAPVRRACGPPPRVRAAVKAAAIRLRSPPPPLPNAVRAPPEIRAPPFQVSETGWGAFEVGIEVFLKEPGAAPFVFSHLLKLYPDPGAAVSADGGAAKPVLSERYDEIVFPVLPADAALRDAILAGPLVEPPPYPYQDALTVFSPEADLAAIASARAWVADRTRELEERLIKARAAESALTHALPNLGIA